jgi:YD repeat-containing protein
MSATTVFVRNRARTPRMRQLLLAFFIMTFSIFAFAQTQDQCLDRGGSIYECRDPDLPPWEYSAATGDPQGVGPFSSETILMDSFLTRMHQLWPCGFEILSIQPAWDLQYEYVGYPMQYRKMVSYRVLPQWFGACYPPDSWSIGATGLYKLRNPATFGGWARCAEGFRFLWNGQNPAVCGRERKEPICLAGNPINPATGAKLSFEVDYVSLANPLLNLKRYYDSHGFNWGTQRPSSSMLGYRWRAGSDQAVSVYGSGEGSTVSYRSADGRAEYFRRRGSAFDPVNQARGTLTATLNGSGAIQSWKFLSVSNTLSTLDSAGRLQTISDAIGRRVEHFYDTQGLTLVRDHLGRSLTYSRLADGKLRIQLPGGHAFEYDFGSGATSLDGDSPTTQLRAVTFDAAPVMSYIYGEVQHVPSPSPWLLTGALDASGTRIATYKYDSFGAVSTESSQGVNRYAIDTQVACGAGGFAITDPLGTRRSSCFVPVGGVLRVGQTDQPAGAGSSACTGYFEYDVRGNTTARDDFRGGETCYAYDAVRNLETQRVEGVPTRGQCSIAFSSPPVGSRLISTQWHPDWRLETRIAEPKKLTIITYNGQGATCAPSTVLVDGKPPAVICTRTEQATTDETGAAGFAATVTGTARTWRYTYTTYGRVLTATDPNNRVTTTSYHADNDADLGKRGNVASITNAANHTTYLTDYNPHGQPTRIVDPNGVVTVLTYDPRMRLTSRTVGNEATVFGYDPVGQMTSVNLPDGARLTYTYDAAHRLTAINDHKGNRIDYTLDAMGNRTAEQMKDPGGVLVGNIARVIDALNRVQQVTGTVQ